MKHRCFWVIMMNYLSMFVCAYMLFAKCICCMCCCQKIGMKILKKINKQNFINLIIEDYIKVMY